LASLLRSSKNHTLPISLDNFETDQIENEYGKHNFFKAVEMESALFNWELNMLPAYLDSLKKYYEIVKAPMPNKSL
ncbi:MAG: hypothetical protein MI749_04615, partial [Desulfovibrionales bacterium]|nr:hypothetical protein [Desulfovibrionales bacterium]